MSDDPQELVSDVERARQELDAVERRLRTFLARRGVIDQTRSGLRSLVAEAERAQEDTRARASSST